MWRLALIFVLAVIPARADAARDCPSYWHDRPLRCAWGYVHVAPAGLLLPPGDVRDESRVGPRLGLDRGVGLGVFRAFGSFGLAFGGRVDAGFTRTLSEYSVGRRDLLRVGPELRFGLVRPRLFVFALVRGGHARWHEDYRARLIDIDRWSGGFVGGGGGVWGRIGSRFLVGGEIIVDHLVDAYDEKRLLILSLSLGLWL